LNTFRKLTGFIPFIWVLKEGLGLKGALGSFYRERNGFLKEGFIYGPPGWLGFSPIKADKTLFSAHICGGYLKPGRVLEREPALFGPPLAAPFGTPAQEWGFRATPPLFGWETLINPGSVGVQQM